MLVVLAVPGPLGTALGFLGVVLGTANVVGGFVVTDRMLAMFQQRRPQRPAAAAKGSGVAAAKSEAKK
jgi:NAD(P) transhydrogenase subunit alpha